MTFGRRMNDGKKIILISANVYTNPYPVYPLGVSYIATYLRSKLPGFELTLFDCNFGSLADLAVLLQEKGFDYIGLSLRNIDDNNVYTRNSFVVWYSEIVRTVRANSHGCLIIGGAGYSIFPNLLFDELKADFGIHGEGEQTWVELLTALEEGRSVEEIEGLVFLDKNGNLRINGRCHYLYDSDLQVEDAWVNYYWDKSGMLNIQTKRGCPFHCIYCSYPVIEGREIRTLDPARIVTSLKKLYHEKGINYVFFTDSVFNIDRKYNQELAYRIIESGIKVNWGAYFSPGNLTKEDLQLYKEAGLTHIEFGSDSFSDKQLKNCKKGFTFADVWEKSKYCDELGIFYAHFLILGGYGETEETLEETLQNSRLLTNTVVFPYVGMRIYPHTELYDIALKEGVIRGPADLLHPVYYISKEVDLSDIEERTRKTGCNWSFPDSQVDRLIARFRAKKRRGPLWEYLRFGRNG